MFLCVILIDGSEETGFVDINECNRDRLFGQLFDRLFGLSDASVCQVIEKFAAY